jgi:hypothetical protein
MESKSGSLKVSSLLSLGFFLVVFLCVSSSLCLRIKRRQQCVVVFFCGGVAKKKKTMAMCHLFLWCYYSEEGDVSLLPSPFTLVVFK